MLARLRRWRSAHPWAPLIGVLAGLGLLFWADARMKAAPFDGYCPDDAAWVAAAEDIASFYANVYQSDTGRVALEELKQPISDLELAIRKLTGVRPTPLRCWAWMGQRFLAASAPEGVGFAVHPGVLMRSVHVFRRVFSRTGVQDGLYAFGPLFYAWRDGFLIVSASPEYVAASLRAVPSDLEASKGRDDVRILHRAKDLTVLHLHNRDELPVSGSIAASLTHRTTPLTLADPWPEPPLCAVSVSRWKDIPVLAGFAWKCVQPLLRDGDAADAVAAVADAADRILTKWNVPALPEGWDRDVDECALAFCDADLDEMTPVPEAALVLRTAGPTHGAHPLAPLFQDAEPAPAEWNAQPGTRCPWLGEKLTACLCSYDRDWLFATNEPAMDRLAGHVREGGALEADAALRVNWRKAGKCVETVLRKAAEYELIPRMNANDVDQRWMPYIRTLSRLGTLRLEGNLQDGRLLFRGNLAQREKGADDKRKP
jgi:hypothetical protein